jgi:DNA-binding PucR family transcriptional regulator
MPVIRPLAAVVASLRPAQDATVPGAMPHADYEQARALLGEGPVGWAIVVARRTADLAIGQDRDDPRAPLAEIYRATEAMLLEILEELVGKLPASRLGQDQRDVIRLSAAREIPSERIVRGLRLAQSHWVDLLFDQAGDVDAKVMLKTLFTVIAGSFDRVVDGVVNEYLAEQERLLTSAAARRRELIEALIAGRPVDRDLARAMLGLDLDGQHLALVIRADPPTRAGAVQAELRQVAWAAARILGVDQVLLHEAAEDHLWAWATAQRIDAGTGLGDLADQLAKARFRIAVGSVRARADGFRRSLAEARAADLVARYGSHGRVIWHRGVDLAALLGSDLERARWFVADHLGELARSDPLADELRETLIHYYAANMSLVGAATPLHVHRNTVIHRLRRIEQILGHPVRTDVLEVRAALLLIAEFGDAVLIS